jgi:hypothetical protein
LVWFGLVWFYSVSAATRRGHFVPLQCPCAPRASSANEPPEREVHIIEMKLLNHTKKLLSRGFLVYYYIEACASFVLFELVDDVLGLMVSF